MKIFMRFKKPYLQVFALSQWGVSATDIQFPKKTKFNSVIRALLTVAPASRKKKLEGGVWIEVPFSSQTTRVYSQCWLSVESQAIVEEMIEDYFYALYYQIAYKSVVVIGGQKRARELFLLSCSLGPDDLKDDTLKKQFYRHLKESALFFDGFIEKHNLSALIN